MPQRSWRVSRFRSFWPNNRTGSTSEIEMLFFRAEDLSRYRGVRETGNVRGENRKGFGP
jgi:hypothetical protein